MDRAAESTRAQLLVAMPSLQFEPPATEAMIADAEARLGVDFPEWLRELYLATNGMRGDGHTRYLFELDGREGTVDFTLFLRSEEATPAWLDRAIVFSTDGAGGTLTVHWLVIDGRLVEWCYGDWLDYRPVDGSFYDVLAREHELYLEAGA